MIYETTDRVSTADTLKSIQDVLSSLPIRVVVTYTVITDGKYLLLKGKEEGESAILGSAANVNINLSDTEIICDLTKQLVYFPGSGKFQRIKKYKLLGDSVNGGKYLIENIDSSNFVELNTNLKNFISPAVFFSNNKYGIQKIHTRQYTLELLGPIIKTNKKLSFQKQFENVKKIDVEEEYSFF